MLESLNYSFRNPKNIFWVMYRFKQLRNYNKKKPWGSSEDPSLVNNVDELGLVRVYQGLNRLQQSCEQLHIRNLDWEIVCRRTTYFKGSWVIQRATLSFVANRKIMVPAGNQTSVARLSARHFPDWISTVSVFETQPSLRWEPSKCVIWNFRWHQSYFLYIISVLW